MNEILVNCFNDTLNISNSILLAETTDAINSNKVYKENFISDKREDKCSADIKVEEDTSLNVARKYAQFGKVAVLNFANPHFPGGGVKKGAKAQEESLCRSSNLYPCLSAENVYNDYYLYNRNKDKFFSDRLIYTKGVTVFKDDSEVPKIMPKSFWFNVDIITCAAPYIANRRYTNKTALKALFKGRIKNIFEAAIDNKVDSIVLGAFGCGAFKNPPDVVAEAFRETIEENNYKSCFKFISYAIKPSDDWTNLEAFLKVYNSGVLICNCPEYTLPKINLPNGKIINSVNVMGCQEMSNFNTDDLKKSIVDGESGFYVDFQFFEDDYEKQRVFIKWQYHNKYFNKQFSILGDSISTLVGYNPKGYKVFFDEQNSEKSNIHDMNDTWWGKVIDFFGGELLVNNSWSGSRVSYNGQNLFPSGCSDERTSGLHFIGVNPDVIIIYLGFNDWANGVELDGTHFLEESLDLSYFVCAYNKMLEKVTSNYPNAEIWCCTLNTTYMSTKPTFNFPYTNGGIHIEEYNREIKMAAINNNCKIIDLYKYNTPYDTIDGSHPNADGMNTLASLVIKEMSTEKANDFTSFLDAVASKTLTDSDEDDDFKNVDVGTILDGKYEILKIVGQSATSKVFLAKLLSLNKLVAVKILKEDYKSNEKVRQALINEANILRRLEFPAIPNVLEIVEKNDNAFIVTDYIEGETLDAIVREWGAQSVEKVIDWAIQICDILEYLHSQEPPIIYRDVKPANFMLQPNGKIKVLDFGIARTYKPNKAADTDHLGTSGYAPPEQYGSAQTDRRSDIYSLGMTMYNICFGIAPKGMDFQVADQAQTAVEKDLLTVIKKCTQLNPNDRYQSCMELKNELEYLKQKGHLKKKFGLFKR